MGSRQYILPAKFATLTDTKEFRLNALAAGIARAFALKVAAPAPSDPVDYDSIKALLASGRMIESVDVRQFQNILDAGTALDQWNTAPLAVVGTAYSMFQAIAAPAIGLRATKILVFYGIAVETIPNPVSRLTFRRTGAVGNVISEFDLEELSVQEVMEGWFTEPIVIDNNTPFAAQVLARIATGAAARIQLINFVFEPAGQTHQ